MSAMGHPRKIIGIVGFQATAAKRYEVLRSHLPLFEAENITRKTGDDAEAYTVEQFCAGQELSAQEFPTSFNAAQNSSTVHSQQEYCFTSE